MPTIDTRPFRPVNNSDIMNAIRNNASSDYRSRIPSATQANVKETADNLLNYQPGVNEFINSLVNLIGLQIVKSNLWTNPLAKFKRGMLSYGDTIEEINVGLIKAKRYDPDREYLEKDLFGQERPDVQTSFHKVNRQDYYKISVNTTMLRRAFYEDYGLSKFITDLMAAPTTSDQWDEFLLTTSLFKTYDDNGGFFYVNVPDVSATSSDANDAKAFLREVRGFADKLKFISTHYNASGMPVAAMPDELELFITPEANAAIDVEALAAAFNIEKANMNNRTTVVPKEYFGISGAQAVLTTKDFFVIADTLIDTANVVNPVGLHTNYFLHHHQIVSASRFVPALLFTTLPGDVINIIETPVTGISSITIKDAKTGDTVSDSKVERGSLYAVTANAITTPSDGVNDAVTYEIAGAESPRTYITQTGTLFISFDESANTIDVIARPVDTTDDISTSVTLTVVGDLLTLWPNSDVTEDSDNDGLLEVTPIEPDFSDNVITIPSITGVQYKNGSTNVNNGSTIEVQDGSPVTINATARSGYEIASGATSSWVFTYA